MLIPYAVLDVACGRERFAHGRSPENEAEARLAAALYGELQRQHSTAVAAAAAIGCPPPPQVSCGIITPYRGPVSYTHRTLPTNREVENSGGAVLVTKNTHIIK